MTYRPCCCVAGALLLLLTGAQVSAQVYSFGQTGTFGLSETWSFNAVGQTLDNLTDEYSVRFTAKEPLTIDRAWQRLISVDAGTQVRIGIWSDDGTGKPGTELSSAIVTPNPAASIEALQFPQVLLSDNTVYHLVTKPTALPVGQSFQIFASTGVNSIRPYDKATDASMNVVTRNNGGAWNVSAADPFFGLGNSSGAVAGPGQPYTTVLTSSLLTQGGTGSAVGQKFRITDAEIPDGGFVRFQNFNFQISAIRNTTAVPEPSADMIIRFRESATGTILGSVTVPVAQADGVLRTFTLDKLVYLQEGVEYLFTTQLSGVSNNNQFWRVRSYLSETAISAANWGGNTFSFPIHSSNNWATHTAGTASQDVAFSLLAAVVHYPEPSATCVLVCLAVSALSHRSGKRCVR